VAAVISAVVGLILAFHQLGGSSGSLASTSKIPIEVVSSSNGGGGGPSPTTPGPTTTSPTADGTSIGPGEPAGLANIQSPDCLPYDPNQLSVVDEGSTGWLLTDGVSRMKELDNASDAQNALALAQRHTAHCFIGRDNSRPNRDEYIVEYWTGDSGRTTTIDPQDCIAYDQAHLSIEDEGDSGWLLTDGSSNMLVLDNQQDSQNALMRAKAFTNQCFFGRGNQRSDRLGYILQYWE
jgi:hypothetical protein